MASTIISGIEKTVKYNRANKDYDCYVTIDGGEPLHIGYAQTAHEGEVKCDQYAFDYLSDNNTPETAAELVMQSEPTFGQRLCAARADVMADEDATTIRLDTRTEAERRYDALKDGSAYVKADEPLVTLRAQIDTEANPDTRKRLIFRLADQVLGITVPDQDIPIGHIDGVPVLASYMSDEPDDANYGALGIMKLTWNGMEISTDGRSYLNLPTGGGGMCGDMEIAEWVAIKALAHTDIPERLIAIAQRYPTYWDTLPPTTPAAPASAVITTYDSSDSGDTQWTDYRAGNVVIGHIDKGDWPSDQTANQLIIHRVDIDEPITGDLVCGLISDLTTLVGHGGVRSALGLPALPVVRAVPHICDDDMDTRLGQVIWVDYIAGEGDAQVELMVECNKNKEPLIWALGKDEIAVDTAEQVARNVLRLLDDPRVKAARAEVKKVA